MSPKLNWCLIALIVFVVVSELAEARYVPNQLKDDSDEFIAKKKAESDELDFFQTNYKYNNKKRGFDIKTFYSPIYRKDGSVILVPKDINKNHYFIG